MIHYIWNVEVVTDATGNAVSDNLFDLYCEAQDYAGTQIDGCRTCISLVRDDENGRSWAYFKNGRLPFHFHDANGHKTALVPARFRNATCY